MPLPILLSNFVMVVATTLPPFLLFLRYAIQKWVHIPTLLCGISGLYVAISLKVVRPYCVVTVVVTAILLHTLTSSELLCGMAMVIPAL